MALILVTGGSGFVGSHCVVQLLQAGHTVRTTVRSLARADDVRRMVAQGGAEPDEKLTFVAADLTADAGWAEAAAGCDYVLHVASPLALKAPRNEDDFIVPARQGTLRVLRAARDAGVKRVVLTSSFGAVSYGHPPQTTPFDESSWTNLSGRDVTPYVKSKTLAERAAWDFIASEGGALELTVINPTGIFGPVLGPDYSGSISVVERMLDGRMPGCPDFSWGIVDVRDVANLHLKAMTDPAAKGERFIAVAGNSLSLLAIATVLKGHLGPAARKAPTRRLPNWLVRIVALGDSSLRQILPQLGQVRNASSDKARRLLGWTPRSSEEAIAAAGESLVRLGLLKTDAR